MFFGLCKFEIFIPQSGSLKQKRSVLKSLKDRIRGRWHASVAEVDTQDLRQRGTLGVALIGTNPTALESAMEAVRRLVDEEMRGTVTSWQVRIEPFTGAAAAPRDLTLMTGGFSSRSDDETPYGGSEGLEENDSWDTEDADDEFFGPQKNSNSERE